MGRSALHDAHIKTAYGTQARDSINGTGALSKNGYEKTSVGDIVEKVGVAQGLFYYYFKSMEEVYRAAMEQYADDRAAEMAAIILDDIPFRSKIQKTLEYMIRLIASGEHAVMDPSSLTEHLDMDNRLSFHVAHSLIDPVAALPEDLNEKKLTAIREPELTATLLIFGIFGLIHGSPDHTTTRLPSQRRR